MTDSDYFFNKITEILNGLETYVHELEEEIKSLKEIIGIGEYIEANQAEQLISRIGIPFMRKLRELETENAALKEALEEQLGIRGYAYRGRCDGVPDDVRRAFIAIGSPCDEIDKKHLDESQSSS
ncbi:MAG: hypothetical protein GTO24_21315 [candidate division Zixibacteria bacterium]|nr:hypothetical protein [candidate division Zixibacteria bacterium]